MILEWLSAVLNFDLFRADLEPAVPRSFGSKGARQPFDRVLMFKTLVLQTSHNLSDERAEYLIRTDYRSRVFSAWALVTQCRTRIRSGTFAKR